MDNNSFLSLSTEQLRRAATIKEQIDSLTSELTAILSGSAAPKRRGRPPGSGSKNSALLSEAKSRDLGKNGSSPRRQMSAAGRARIAAAARARWAKYNAEKGGAPKNNSALLSEAKSRDLGKSSVLKSGRRQMSPAARARIAAAAKARWAKAKAAGKSRL